MLSVEMPKRWWSISEASTVWLCVMSKNAIDDRRFRPWFLAGRVGPLGLDDFQWRFNLCMQVGVNELDTEGAAVVQ